jgi:hypothetical protein
VILHTTLSYPSKEKIALYVGIHFGSRLFLWFNTKPQRRPGQMAVVRREAPGITHDCFLDCGRAVTHTDTELASAINRGRASDAFLARVADEVEARAATLTKGQRTSIARTLKA